MIIVLASTLLCIAINLGKLALLSIAMVQTMIMVGGTWIALRKLRSIQATPADRKLCKPVGWVERSASGAKPIIRRVMQNRWVSRRYALLYPSYNNTMAQTMMMALTTADNGSSYLDEAGAQ